MSSNVLPSTPELYPQLHSELNRQLQPDFRMQKVNEILASLNKKVDHYRAVGKNINVPRKLLTGVRPDQVFFLPFSQARFGSAISVVGLRLQYLLAELVVA